MAQTVDASHTAPQPSLRRVIGRRTLLFFVMGDILGAGIYVLVGKVAGYVGGMLWLPFLLAFVLSLLTAAAYAELAGKYSQAAGAALYVNKAFGVPFLTFIVAFAIMISGVTSAGVSAQAFGGRYLAEFVTLPVLAGALIFLGLVTLVNFAGISESIKVNVALTIVEASGLAVIVAIGIYALLTGEGNPGRAIEFNPANGAFLSVLQGTALAFYALLGFEDSVNLAEEAKDPPKDFPLALIGGVVIAALIYIAVAFTAAMLVDTKTLTSSSGPLLEVVKVAGLAFPPKLFAVIALLAVGNTALMNMIMASRLVYGMSREGVVPPAFARVHAARGTPWVAILFTVGLAVVLVTTGDIGGLAETSVLLLLCVFAVVNVSVLVLRKDRVGHVHYRAPTWMPALGALVCITLALPITGRDASVYIRVGVLVGIGVVLWFVNRLFVRKGREIDAILIMPDK
jgi:APA family basic amino acid/polyamine antiporter